MRPIFIPANVMGPCSTLLLPVVVTRFARKTPADPPLNATALVSASSLACGTAAGHKGRSSPTNPAGYSDPGCVCRAGSAERAPDELTQGFRGRLGSIYDFCMRCLTLQGGERCGIDDFPLYASPRPVKTLNYPMPDPLPSPHTPN